MDLRKLGIDIIDIRKANASMVPKARSTKPRYIVIHFLGVANADNPDLYAVGNTRGYGGHFYISRNGKIYCAADPDTATVWHCGGGLQGDKGHSYYQICTNANSVGIECGVSHDGSAARDDDGRWFFSTATQDALVLLVRSLMAFYGIPADHVIRHYDVTGKCCPAPWVANNHYHGCWTWNEFKDRLNEAGSSTDEAVNESVGRERDSDVINPEKYVRDLYAILFGREPGSQGLETWVAKLKADGDAGELLTRLAFSDEGAPRTIESLYESILGRPAGRSDIDAWKDAGLSPSEVLRKILHSKEYLSKN